MHFFVVNLNIFGQARVHLVRELKNLSVIVENLYQRNVFSDEEVIRIQEEINDYDKIRKILDLVMKKGEAACYEFLRIIDMTRKRTLGTASLTPYDKSGAWTETKTFDLHHWISCYSFKEDTQMDINYLQDLFDDSHKIDLSYTPLVLDTEGSLRTYLPEEKSEISPGDLLKTDKNIVLVGKAGIGKTALTQEMLKVWAESDSKELDYMFYFNMREMTSDFMSMSLEELLFSEPDEFKEEVLADMKKNSDSVTIIFDGITDLSSSVVRRLVEKDLLPDAKIIITCRPDDEEDFFSWDSLRVEVKGFSEQSIETYFSATLGEQKNKVWSNLELLTLCYVPMYAVMVAACFSSEDPQPCTITKVYVSIVRFCLERNSNKTKIRHLESYINSKGMEILSLAEVAFQATGGKTANLTELPCYDSSVLSFLKPLVIQRNLTERYATHAFLHYTMQEFFAALWLLKNPDKAKDVLQQCLTEEMKHMRPLIPFMCGLLSEKSPSLMKCLIPAEELKKTSNWFFKEMTTTFYHCLCEQDEADTEDSGSDVDILFLCRCLYESQCPDACIYLLDKLDYCLDLAGEILDPYSSCAVAYVVTQSKKKIQLNLEDVMVSEHGMRCLFGCLKNVQWYGCACVFNCQIAA
uniref:CARD domain-containing protein n=1 Tax=Seriola dumerili TaxID=41447 RepID=A0A3B4VJG5_SERDU